MYVANKNKSHLAIKFTSQLAMAKFLPDTWSRVILNCRPMYAYDDIGLHYL